MTTVSLVREPAPDVETNRGPLVSRTIGATAAVLGGLFWISQGVMQITAGEEVRALEGGSTLWHAGLGVLAFAMVFSAIATVRLGAYSRLRAAAYIAAIGQIGVAVMATTSNVNGGDFSWFPMGAVPANLMAIGGFVALGISLYPGKLAATFRQCRTSGLHLRSGACAAGWRHSCGNVLAGSRSNAGSNHGRALVRSLITSSRRRR